MASSVVLVVEDNPVEQRVLSILLERYGYTVVVALNAKQALKLYSEQKFNLILMDWHMPEMTGLACAAAIREMEGSSGRRVPIIAVTARTQLADRQRCLDAGMDDYLSKPFTPNEFQEMLDCWAACG